MAEHAKRAHATKIGPGRYYHNGTPRGSKRDRPGGCGEFSLILRNWITSKQKAAMEARK